MNSKELNEKLEYKEHIKILPTDEKINFLVDELFNINIKFDSCLPPKATKEGAISGGITGAIITIAGVLYSIFGNK
jgi:hypothetical protein